MYQPPGLNDVRTETHSRDLPFQCYDYFDEYSGRLEYDIVPVLILFYDSLSKVPVPVERVQF